MENEFVLERIANLRGRRNYEEKKAFKLGFVSLYDYFEDKMSKEMKGVEESKKTVFSGKPVKIIKSIKQKSCSCC
jgi:hypothetical protein